MNTWANYVEHDVFPHAFHAVVFHVRGVSMRFLLSVLFMLLGAYQAVAGEVRIDAERPFYHNDRYGFSMCWTPGTYSIFEPDNGDGITVRDGKGLELLA